MTQFTFEMLPQMIGALMEEKKAFDEILTNGGANRLRACLRKRG